MISNTKNEEYTDTKAEILMEVANEEKNSLEDNNLQTPLLSSSNTSQSEENKQASILFDKDILSGLAGNLIEYYDFAVYGYVSDAIGDAFFPEQAGDAAMIESFLVFGGSFLMRPCKSKNHACTFYLKLLLLIHKWVLCYRVILEIHLVLKKL